MSEQDEFPLVCEVCLGNNPYVRMTKLPSGDKLCKITHVPFQAYRWKAGVGGRYKETVVSRSVARERNLCQCCLNDLQFGVPVGVRDALMRSQAQGLANATSIVGQRYVYAQQERLQAELGSAYNPHMNALMDRENAAAVRQLDNFSNLIYGGGATRPLTSTNTATIPNLHSNSVAFRNLPKLCSFWMGGGCNRVARKTCPFRPCCGTFVFPEIAGKNRELCDALVARLQKEGPEQVMKTLDSETRSAIQASQRGNREEAIKKRVAGSDELTEKYLGRIKSMNCKLELPEDESIKTLWLGGITVDITEAEIREGIFSICYQPVVAVRIANGFAFVEFADRSTAEVAADGLVNALNIRGRIIDVRWAKPKVNNNDSAPQGSISKTPSFMSPPLLSTKRPAPENSDVVSPSTKRSNTGSLVGLLGDYSDSDDEAPVTTKPTATTSAPVKPSSILSVPYPSMNPNRMGAEV